MVLQSKNAVITTTGVEKLHSIEWQREKSELDKFSDRKYYHFGSSKVFKEDHLIKSSTFSLIIREDRLKYRQYSL